MSQSENGDRAKRIAPQHFTRRQRAFFKRMITQYPELVTDGWVDVLIQACEAKHRAEQAKKELDKLGLVFYDRWGSPKPRPEASIEQAARGSFLRYMQNLKMPRTKKIKSSQVKPRSRG